MVVNPISDVGDGRLLPPPKPYVVKVGPEAESVDRLHGGIRPGRRFF